MAYYRNQFRIFERDSFMDTGHKAPPGRPIIDAIAGFYEEAELTSGSKQLWHENVWRVRKNIAKLSFFLI